MWVLSGRTTGPLGTRERPGSQGGPGPEVSERLEWWPGTDVRGRTWLFWVDCKICCGSCSCCRGPGGACRPAASGLRAQQLRRATGYPCKDKNRNRLPPSGPATAGCARGSTRTDQRPKMNASARHTVTFLRTSCASWKQGL